MTSRCLPLLLSLLLCAAPGWAAPDLRLPAPDSPRTPRALSLLAEPGAPAPPGTQELAGHEGPRERPGQAVRILAELGLGLAGGLAGVLAGSAVGSLVPCHETGFLACWTGPMVGGVVGGLVGLPLGIWLGGSLARGQGTFLATLAGMGLGITAAFVLALLSAAASTQILAVVGFGILPVAGAIIAYERTDAEAWAAAPPLATRPGLRPLLALTSGGGLVGLRGHF